MQFGGAKWSRKLHLAGLQWLLALSLAEAGFGRSEALPHCLLQRSQQTQRRVEHRTSSSDEGLGKDISVANGPKDGARKVSLLQAKSDAASWRDSRRKLELDPSFFDSFADAESTFDEDGRSHVEAANPAAVSEESVSLPTIEPPQWFDEGASAGAKEAWQTYDLETEGASWRAKAPDWKEQGFGRYEQGWMPVESREKGNADREDGKEAAWFDTAVDQYDLFGRPRAPSTKSANFYVEWSRVSRTADWSCGPPGCVANASLKVFEKAAEMEYAMCHLSVMVHATDFDDQYGHEKVEWIVVNGKEVIRDFAPQAPKGCEMNDDLAALHGSDVTVQNISNFSLLAVRAQHVRR
ncbi:unnamed protein product [Symbiodinium pilosum]|uniref:Uncharacterized protein n=1 Tax=Symbiodinium pilosum TaxID=2952 RepID=A0A812SXR4_SYMPI|nr:unnamed protein product [Symbiodinium pilosum]